MSVAEMIDRLSSYRTSMSKKHMKIYDHVVEMLRSGNVDLVLMKQIEEVFNAYPGTGK